MQSFNKNEMLLSPNKNQWGEKKMIVVFGELINDLQQRLTADEEGHSAPGLSKQLILSPTASSDFQSITPKFLCNATITKIG